jgi:UDP-glucose 4-epimerase
MKYSTKINDAQVIGRGYLGQVISDGIGCSHEPISIDFQAHELSAFCNFVIMASGPSTSSINDTDRKIFEKKLANSIENIKLLKGNSHLIYISSGGTVYGNCAEKKFSEASTLIKTSPYSNFQINAEEILRENHSGPLTILRLSNAYGPKQLAKLKQGFISAAIRSILFEEELKIFGDGENIRDYIHENDIVSAIKKILKKPVTGIFNVSTGIGISQNNAVALIEKIFNKKLRRVYLDKRSSDLRRSIISPELFMKTFEWTPDVDIFTGVKTYLPLANLIRDKNFLEELAEPTLS